MRCRIRIENMRRQYDPYIEPLYTTGYVHLPSRNWVACRPASASGFILISESRVRQLTSGCYAYIHSPHTWMGFGWDKEKLGREVGKNLVPLEQGLANDSCWCKYFHCNTDSSFVCIISVLFSTCTGKGGLPHKACGLQGLSWGDTGYFKRNQVKSKPSTGMPFYSIYLFGCGKSLLWHMGLLVAACGI